MDCNKIIGFSNNLIKGAFFTLKIETKPDLLAKGNPFYQYVGGKLVCTKEITEITSLVAFTGAKYSDMVKRRQEYISTPIKPSFTSCNIIHKWEIPYIIGMGMSGYYLRYHYYPNSVHEHYFMIDGNRATKDETKIINEFKRKRTANAPKWNIPSELNFLTRNVKVENVVSIKQGSKIYNR